MKGIVEAVKERRTVEDAFLNSGVLVVTYKPARQPACKSLAARLEKEGFKALRKGRVLAVKLPSEEGELSKLEAILRPMHGRGVKEVAEELVKELLSQ